MDNPYIVAWIVGGLLTIVYGLWCRRLKSMGLMEMDVLVTLVIVAVWPIVLPWLIGAHVNRGRKAAE